MIGSWSQSDTAGRFPASIHIWIGDRVGYPVGFYYGPSHQLQFHECYVQTTAGPRLPVVLYAMERQPRGSLNTYFALSYWGVAEGVYLQIEAAAHDSITQQQFLNAFETINIVPR
jgi:hypothetical protein